jgi:Fe-S-cluster containining protein
MKEITELHRLIDQTNARLAEESAKNGHPITCKVKGCFACCNDPLYVSDSEVKHMLDGYGEKAKNKVAALTAKAIDKLKPTGLLDMDEPPVMKWREQNITCPFLDIYGHCSVYERRPIGCRSHMAVGPAEWCDTNRENQKYPMSDELSAVQGSMILAAHMKIGGPIIHDNLLALLANQLLDDPIATASRQIIQIERTEDGTKDYDVGKRTDG